MPEYILVRDRYGSGGGQQRRNSLYVRETESICMHVCVCWSTCKKQQMWKEVRERDEDGRRLQSGSSSVIAPEAALSGTIPHRPPNATATAEMPVRQDIQCEMIQSELREIKKKCCIVTLRQNHCNASKFISKSESEEGEIQLLMEVHLLCFLCGHAAVILLFNTDGCVSCIVSLYILCLHACVLSSRGGYS